MHTYNGLHAHELSKGTMVNGRRVIDLRPGLSNGQRVITVFVEGKPRGRKGRVRPEKLGTFALGESIPGTRTPTTWAMPAGPVGREPGTKLSGGWYGDADARDRGARADRHHRMIESITYAAA
jgi:hypothetical protein